MLAHLAIGCAVTAIACATSARVHAIDGQVPPDFALRLELHDCASTVIDTYKGEVINDRGKHKRLKLSQGQNRELYEAVVAASVFDASADLGMLGSMTGDLEPLRVNVKVTMSGAVHEVGVTLGNRRSIEQAEPPIATRLLSLVHAIQRIAREDRAFKIF